MNTETARKLAGFLLEIEAVKLRPEQPFTWASGWKSPIYCDNRLTLSYPKIRSYIKNALYEMILEAFPGVEAIAGVATAGIPQGALVADMLGVPFLYVRAKAKEHGMGNLIEGRTEPLQKVVIVEDLVSTGKSSLQAADALWEAEAEVLGMAAIFTYGFETAEKVFAIKNVPLVTLTNYEILIEEAVSQNYLLPELLDSLQAWRKNPETWGL